ncbi:MAG: Sapep family Mn(2+)-dependent dipeptidase [Clostridia bacterium]|nr:Sapep family Mn(2+)-dependent dipeptidase [Clostridia bacterium]
MKQKITEFIYAHRDEMVETLKALVKIPSVQSEKEEDAPYGKECAALLDAVSRLYEESGFPTKRQKENMYSLAYLPGGKRTIGVFAHGDVVPVGDDWTVTKPFEPIEKDGFLFGRGVRDNKSGIVATLFALRAVRELSLPFSSTVMAFTGSNEESGMADVRRFAIEEPMPDVSLVPDMSFPHSMGEKGIMRFFAVCDAPLTVVKEANGGTAFNVVLDQAIVRLAPHEDLAEEIRNLIAGNPDVTLEETEDELVLRATGVSAHAAVPDGSVNAAYLAFTALANCANIPERDREILTTASMLLSTCHGESFGVGFSDSAFGPLTCANGIVKMEEGRLFLSFDIRYGTEGNGEEIQTKIRRMLAMQGWHVEEMDDRPGYRHAENDKVCKLLQNVCKQFERANQTTYFAGGGTYARHLKNAYGTGSATESGKEKPNLPEGHGAVHQCDEYMDVEGLMEGTVILTMMLLALDNE